VPSKTASYRCVVRYALTLMLRAAICDAARIVLAIALSATPPPRAVTKRLI